MDNYDQEVQKLLDSKVWARYLAERVPFDALDIRIMTPAQANGKRLIAPLEDTFAPMAQESGQAVTVIDKMMSNLIVGGERTSVRVVVVEEHEIVYVGIAGF